MNHPETKTPATEGDRQPEKPKYESYYDELYAKYWWVSIPPSIISILISSYMILKILKVL